VTAKFTKLLILATVVAVSASCGDLVRQGHAPVTLVIKSLLDGDDQSTLRSDVITNGSIQDDMAKVVMALVLKDPGSLNVTNEPSLLNQVTITRYHVEYQRTDGRNVQGVDVPFAFDSAMTFTVPEDGDSDEFVFEIVRHSAKAEAPLRALMQSGGIINTIATISFYGHDQVGNKVSATAMMGINFADFADPEQE
jgi:hypothetical protein